MSLTFLDIRMRFPPVFRYTFESFDSFHPEENNNNMIYRLRTLLIIYTQVLYVYRYTVVQRNTAAINRSVFSVVKAHFFHSDRNTLFMYTYYNVVCFMYVYTCSRRFKTLCMCRNQPSTIIIINWRLLYTRIM